MRKIYLIFIFINLSVFSQSKEETKDLDSIFKILPSLKEDSVKVNLLNKVSYKNDYLKINDRKKFVNDAIRISNKINFENGLGKSYATMGKIFSKEYNKDKTFEYLNKALIIFKKLNNKNSIARIYNTMGNTYADFNNYSLALENYFKAAKINESSKNYEKLATNYSNICDIYKGLEDTKKAIFYGNLAIKYSLKVNDIETLVFTYNAFTQLYSNNNDLKMAENYAIKSYDLSIKNLDINSVATSLFGLGHILQRKKDYANAVNKIEEALAIFIKIENKLGMASAYNELGICNFSLFEKNKTKLEYLVKAKSNFTKSNELYIENDLIDGLQDNYLYLSKIYDIEKNPTKSLENFKLHSKFKDSIYNSDNKETIKNLEDKREIELRDKEIKINKLSLEAKEKQKWLFVAGIGFLAIIGGLLFYQSRKRKLTNLKLETLNKTLDQNNLKLETLNKDLDQANKAKTRFFGILNHDLRGPVSNLVIFLQLQQEAPEMLDEESTKRMQDKTMDGAKNLLASMEDILQWSKSQMENFKPQPKNVSINQLFDDTRKVFSGYLNIKIEYQNPDNIEIFTDDNYLKTIIRNLTSNAINVLAEFVSSSAVERQIIWKAWQIDKVSYLSITDNGPGANPEKLKALFEESELGSTKSGLGLHLIRDMAKAIDCEISVESKIGIGTTFILKIK